MQRQLSRRLNLQHMRLTVLILLLVAVPIAALLGLFHAHAGIWTFALAVIAALSMKVGLVDPFATVALIQVYDTLTSGQTPNPEWIAKLESMSDQFRELTQKARTAGALPSAALPVVPVRA